MSIPIDTPAVLGWLSNRFLGADVLGTRVLARRRLTGGVASPLVERVDLGVELAGGRTEAVAVLAKRASRGELVAMREIGSPPELPTFPELIDSGRDEAGPWLLMPFYPGEPLSWDASPPDQVYADLARLHAGWLGRTDELPADVPRVDAEFCRRTLLEFASDSLRRAARAADGPSPVHDRGLECLRRWGNDALLYEGLSRLPVTFLHGDVYGLNVLVADGRPPRLVDWGSARVGPAMLDVAVGRGTGSGLRAYSRSWQQATGTPLDSPLFELDLAWSTWFTCGMFVGAVAERAGPTPAATMLDEGEAAYQRLAALLS
ncbi:phosphotransferase family protein [Flindersiella endophytica]